MQKYLRTFFPWLFAFIWCVAFVFFLQIVFTLSPEKSNNIQTALPGSLVVAGTEIPGINSVSERLIERLSFSPDSATKKIPLVVSVIENHEDARPHQKGIRNAEAIFEFVVEGDITRFLAFFRSDRLPDKIGPVRSLREYMVSLALGYKPLVLHAGGHPFAYDALARNPDLINHDGIRYDGETYERDPDGTPPHNLFMRRAPLQSIIEENNLKKFDLPIFHTTSNPTSPRLRGAGEQRVTSNKFTRKININMGSPTHDVTFLYKSLYSAYTRSTAEAPKQAQPKPL